MPTTRREFFAVAVGITMSPQQFADNVKNDYGLELTPVDMPDKHTFIRSAALTAAASQVRPNSINPGLTGDTVNRTIELAKKYEAYLRGDDAYPS